MKLLNYFLVFSLFSFLFFFVFLSIASGDYDDCTIYGNCPPSTGGTTINNNTFVGNASAYANFWDLLDTPADITAQGLIQNYSLLSSNTSLQDAYDNGNGTIKLSNSKSFKINSTTGAGFRYYGKQSFGQQFQIYMENTTGSLLEILRVGSDVQGHVYSRTWLPFLNNSFDFGSPDLMWRDGYFAGKLISSNINISSTGSVTTSKYSILDSGNINTTGNITALTGTICDSNGCIGAGGSGNPFDQDLNTTNNVGFMNVTINSSIKDANSNNYMYYDLNGTLWEIYHVN